MNKEELIEYKIYNQWEDDVRKCENRLLRITRNIKRNIKKHDKVYIPPIRFYYDSDTDCGLQCNDETKDCKKCDSFFILEIKVSAIIDIYLDGDNYLLYVEQDVLSSKEYEIVLLKYNKDTDERLWYMEKCVENGWSVDVLAVQIDTKLYERQGKQIKDNNFKEKLISPLSDLANNMQKDP